MTRAAVRRGRAPAGPRRVVLGVSGSIAAYKAAEIARGLAQEGCAVRCVVTPNAARFVSPLTLSVLSRHPCAQDPFDPSLWEMAHLALAGWADLILIAPATADFMARLASGRAEGLLDALVLAARGPVAICPAMDEEMWRHPATQANVRRLRSFGYRIWGPARGELASGRVGMGRLLDVQEIVRRAA